MSKRGAKKHLKRIHAPRSWMLSKTGGIWAPKTSPGPHKGRESIPLGIVLRHKLKYALTGREVTLMVHDKNCSIKIDGKKRTDNNFPLGPMGFICKKMSFPLDKLGKTIESSTTPMGNSSSKRFKRMKLITRFLRLKGKRLVLTKSPILLLMIPGPSDSHTLISTLMTQSSSTSVKIRSKKSINSNSET